MRWAVARSKRQILLIFVGGFCFITVKCLTYHDYRHVSHSSRHCVIVCRTFVIPPLSFVHASYVTLRSLACVAAFLVRFAECGRGRRFEGRANLRQKTLRQGGCGVRHAHTQHPVPRQHRQGDPASRCMLYHSGTLILARMMFIGYEDVFGKL